MTLLAASAVLATGCTPMRRHNLPPEQRMLEPGPGVGGPGPGVMGPPAVAPGGGGMMGPGMMGPGMMGQGPMMGPGMMGQGPPMGPGAGMMGGAPMMGPNGPMASMTDADPNGVQPVGYDMCGPDCGRCGGTGACLQNLFGGGERGGLHSNASNIPPGGGVLPTGAMMPMSIPTVQVTLGQPDGMQVRYDVSGGGTFDSEPLVVPVRQNFPQGGLYRLKLTNIPTREGVELYPTVELAHANPRTGAYLAHNAIPLQFTEEDFDQVLTGNFVTKVIYLPDPEFQGPALVGIDTIVSTRLDPGIDPIVEADRRGSILAIIRLGDKDIEMAGGAAEGMASGMMAGGYAGGMAPPIGGLPAPFAPAMTAGCGGAGDCQSCGPAGCGCGGMGTGGSAGCVGMPPQLPGMVSGMSAPQYGMPITGTPIGLAGPPHIPLGIPAGLKKHVMKNHTPLHLPRPVHKMKIDVGQKPGYSYPNPVSRVKIQEQNINPGVPAGRPGYMHNSQAVDPYCNQ